MSSFIPFKDVDVNQIKGNIDNNYIKINMVCVENLDKKFLNMLPQIKTLYLLYY